jgi:hypothetical protein
MENLSSDAHSVAQSGQYSGDVNGHTLKPFTIPESTFARFAKKPEKRQSQVSAFYHKWATDHLAPFAQKLSSSTPVQPPQTRKYDKEQIFNPALNQQLDKLLRQDPKSLLDEMNPNAGHLRSPIPDFEYLQHQQRQNIRDSLIKDRSMEPKRKTRQRNYFDNSLAGGGSGYTDYEDSGPYQRSRSYHPDYRFQQIANKFTDKEHRQHDHIVESEKERGVSPEKADEIGWATVNKQKTASDALLKFLSKYAESDPCWDGYEMVGTKKKNGKTVPNCVPKSKKEAADNKGLFNRLGPFNDTLDRPDYTKVDKPMRKDVEHLKNHFDETVDNPKESPLNQTISYPGDEIYPRSGTKPRFEEQPPNFRSDLVSLSNKKYAGDNRAMDLERQIKDSNKSKSGKKYYEPAGTQNQPRDKGVKMPKGKNLAKAKPAFKSASVTEALFNIYQEAYGVQVGPGSGGNYSMGPSIDMSSKQRVDPGQGAQMDTVQWKTKDKKIPKSKLQPGQDPIIPGKMKEAPRYTMMTPDQKVNYVKDDEGNLVNNKSNGLPKTTPSKYDRSPLTEDSLRQLYPSLYENDNKQPGKLRQFVDWLKGIHQQTFGKKDEYEGVPTLSNPRPFSNPNLDQERYYRNMKGQNSDLVASQIRGLVKTAVLEDNGFKTILAAMNEMGYTSGDILAAFS